MAQAYKVLAQSAPSATTLTDVYTASAGVQVVASTITDATYRIAVRASGASLANQHYIAFGATVAANDTVALTLGITLQASDIVTIYASNANLSFTMFGCEITS
jgi:hypothetical protein